MKKAECFYIMKMAEWDGQKSMWNEKNTREDDNREKVKMKFYALNNGYFEKVRMTQ